MSTTDNYGTQRVSIDFKLPLKGSYFTEQLYSIVKPGVYKGLEVSIAANNVTGYQVDITKGQAFLNCVFESETKRSVKVQFQSNVNSYNIPQSASGLNEVIYLVYEYKEIVENWVAISHIAASGTLPDNAIVLAECSYDNSGNIINVSYKNRQYGFFNSDDNYSINDDNIFSNISDSTKKFRFSASGISGTDIVRTVIIPDHDYTLNTINDWVVDTRYKQNEVILNNKTLYRCLTEHTSVDFFSDLDLMYWENMTAVSEEEIVLGYNDTGLILLTGKVIKVSGDFPSEKIPEVSLISDYLDEPFGIVIYDISNLNSGELIQRGRIQLLSYDFSSGVAGQKIYCDNTGSLTLSVTPLIIGQLLDPINSIIYVAILPAEEGLDVINFNGQLSVNENSVQKAFDRIDDYGYIPVWMTSKSYRVGNSITKDGIIYTCLIAHTSNTFSTDLSANRWLKVQSYLNVSNLNGQLSSGVETSYQQVIDRLDDYGYIPSWQSGLDYRIGNAIRRIDDSSNSAWICVSNHTSTVFSSDISNWIALTDSTAFKILDSKNLTSSNSNISVSGGTNSTLQDVDLTLNPNLTLETVTLEEILFNSLNTISSSGQINNLANDNYTYIKLSNATSLTGLVSSSQNKILIVSNTSASGLTVVNESTASTAANRIITGRGNDLVLASSSSMFLIYDSNSSRWRIININSGLNVKNFIISSDYSIVSNELIFIDSTGGSVNITLPSLPNNGDKIGIADAKYYSSVNNIVILRNGKKINNLVQNFTVNTDGLYIELIYDSTNSNWIVTNAPNQSVQSSNVPTGSEIFFEDSNPDSPAYSTSWVECNGQVISDISSPYNGKRIRNLNGATITGIAITALDDTLKTFTVSLNDVYALMVGDSITPDVSVPNAVIKSINYTTGVIEIGDFTLWSSGSFGLTTSTLTGATAFDTVGLKRFTRGNSSNSGGGGVNTLQGFNIANGDRGSDPASTAIFAYIVGTNSLNSSNGAINILLSDNGTDNTPRTSSETSPNYADGVWLKKIK